MAESLTIDPTATLPPHQDYAALREEAISQITTSPGASWSDINPSEPGITLLEAAVDALTDLGYRLEHSIADLLSPPDREHDWQPLPEGGAALGVAPVSQLDIENMLADVTGIRRASLQPAAGRDKARAVLLTPAQPPENSRQAAMLAQSAWRQFHRLRPLGMRPGKVSLREPSILKIFPELELAEHAPVESTLATLLLRWLDYLETPTVYRDAADCLADGQSGDTVFAGPTLQKGVLQTTTAPLQRVLASELIRLAADVEGIARVDSLLLGDSNGQRDATQWSWQLAQGSYISLDLDSLLDWWHGSKVLPQQNYAPLHRQGQRLPLDKAGLRALLTQKAAQTAPAEPVRATAGRYRRLREFPPFTFGLPAVFGVSRSGLNPAASRAEQAPPLQLQAYLLFMEQLLANQSAQLENIRRLLEIPAGPWLAHCGKLLLKMQRNEALSQGEIDRFWLEIGQLPASLLRQPVAPLPTASSLFGASDLHDYHEQSREIALEGQLLDPRWLDRQSRRLRHLLARFGETQPDASVLRYRGMYRPLCPVLLSGRHAPSLDAGELAERLAALRHILDMAAFLQHLPLLSGRRGQGADLLASTTSRSGLEARVAQKLGFILDDAPLSLGNREGLYLIEGALLAPSDTHPDGTGYRLADSLFWVLPAYGTRLGNSGFRQLVCSVIAAETPLHLTPMVCWLGADDLNVFERTYRHWRAKWLELGMPPDGEAASDTRDGVSGLTRRQRLDASSHALRALLEQQDFLALPDSHPWQSHIGISELAHNFSVAYPTLTARRIFKTGSRISDPEQPFAVSFTPPLPLQD